MKSWLGTSTRRLLVSAVLAFGIGVACNFAAIPLPAPTALIGAVLVLALTVGYLGTDYLLSTRRSR